MIPSLAQAKSATAAIKAEIVAPAVVSATAAAGLILSASPGVLTLRIPGAAPAATLALTATAVEGGSGAIVFTTPRESAGVLRQLIAAVSAGAEAAAARGDRAPGLATNGVIHGQGVQVVVTKAIQESDGGGTVTAIISYD